MAREHNRSPASRAAPVPRADLRQPLPSAAGAAKLRRPVTAPDPAPRTAAARSAWVLGGLTSLAAALLLVPGFRAHGLWSTGEIAVLQRAQAALGAALGGLERAPFLPDALRTQALALTGDAAAIRLPGALASALLVGLTVALARRLGAAPRFALLAGGFALATPLLQSQARLALGNPVGELTATLAALLGAAALAQPRRGPALGLALAALASLLLASASAGLFFGALLPLVAIALAWPRGPDHWDMSPRTSPTDLSPSTSQAPSANLSPGTPSTDLSPGTPSADLSPKTSSPDLSPETSPASSPDPSPVTPPLPRPRWLAALLALAILAIVATLLALIYGQGDGWIPALGAARDLALGERPHLRPFTATFEEFSNQIFPWLPLLLVGLLHPGRARWPAAWLLLGLVLISAWSLRFGPQPVPLTVPAAVVCTAALEHLLGPHTGRFARRLGLLVALIGGLILAKDARRTPSRVGAVLVHGKGENAYPARELQAPDLLAGLAQLAALGLLLAILARRPLAPASRFERLQARFPTWLPLVLVLAVQLHAALRYGQGLLPRSSELLSLHRPLTRLAGWQAAGALPGPLALHRISDPGVDLYGPPEAGRAPLTSRDQVVAWLRAPEPAAALVRASELGPLFQQSRAAGWPLHVLDASNRDIVLVSNSLPPGATDENPILRVLFDAPPALAHTTSLRFDDYLEIVGWQWQEPIVRGRETTLELAIQVLKPLPAGSKIYVRLQQGRLSRINPLPHELAEGLYPSQLWRAGDFIHHRFTVAVPMLEVMPGAHEVVIGLRRTESANYKISVPEGDSGEHGVSLRGGREFATVGEVQVW